MIKYIRKNKVVWLLGILIPPISNLACNLCFANALKNYSTQLINRQASFNSIVSMLILTMFALLFFSCVDDVGRYLFSFFAASTEQELKQDIYDHMIYLKPRALKVFHQGGWLTRYTSDVEQSVLIVSEDVYGIIYPLIVGGGYLTAVLISDVRIGIIMFVLAAGVIGLNFLFLRKISFLQKETVQKRENYAMCCRDIIHGKMSVRQYGAKYIMSEKISESAKEILKKECEMAKLQGIKRCTSDGLANVCTYLLTPVACVMTVIGYMELPVVLYIQQICQEFIPYAQFFVSSFIQFSTHKVSYDRVCQVFSLPLEECDSRVHGNGESTEKRTVCSTKGTSSGMDISFDQVSVSYEDHPVLKNVTFTMHPGEIVALTGESGSGKTTLVKALLQMVDYQGKITIGGKNCADVPLQELRNQVAFSPEHGELFDTTLYENLQYGNLQATENDMLAGMYGVGFMDTKELDKDTLQRNVGENGSFLSGGQKQKVSVARAILKDAPILILDEPTAALDPDSEAKVLESLCALKEKGKCILLITHKPSTLQIADKILCIKDGTLTEGVNM